MDTLVIIDYSNILSMCWYPALDAEEAGKAALAEHIVTCGACAQLLAPNMCQFAKQIKQYDPNEVLKVNLDGKMMTILEDLTKYGITDFKTVFAEDRYAKDKYTLFPDYKGKRDLSRPKPPKQLGKDYLKSKGFKNWVWVDDHEADDAIATFVVQIGLRLKSRVVVVSGDKDLWPLMEHENVFCYNPYTGKLIDINDVAKKFSVSRPKFIPLAKALWGDTSDNIPNAIPRMQKQLIPLIERSDGSLENFKMHLANSRDSGILSERCLELWGSGHQQVHINERLVRLDTDCKLLMENDDG